MLNLVRELNLSVRLSSTGLALKVRLHFRTCSHLFCFFFFLVLLENGLKPPFSGCPSPQTQKKLLVNLLLFFRRNRWNSRPKTTFEP